MACVVSTGVTRLFDVRQLVPHIMAYCRVQNLKELDGGLENYQLELPAGVLGHLLQMGRDLGAMGFKACKGNR